MTWKKTKECFSIEEVNRKRQIELDVVKGIAIIFMVLCHALLDLGGDLETPFGFFIYDVLGGPFAAPVFMFCMGIGIAYSRRSTPSYLLKRGLILFFGGYLLNLIRFTIPILTVYAVTKQQELLEEAYAWFFGVDILQFAGLAFILFAAWKKTRLTWKWLFLFGVVLSLVSFPLNDVGTGDFTIDALLGIFYGTGEVSCFPLFNVFLIPVVGFKIGEILLHLEDKKTIYIRSLIIFLPLSVGIELILHIFGLDYYGDFVQTFWLTIFNIISLCSFCIAWISLWGLIFLSYKKERVPFLSTMSENVTIIYVIHWLLIEWTWAILTLIFDYDVMPYWAWFLLTIPILFGSHFLAIWYRKLRSKSKKNTQK